MQSIKNSNQDHSPPKKLNAYSLAGLGIGGIIGSGLFLGSAISIKQAGPSVILAFLLSGFIISQVLGAMTSISINRPVTGSFKVYAEQFLGKYIGFLIGWNVYVSNVLSIGSEAIRSGDLSEILAASVRRAHPCRRHCRFGDPDKQAEYE